MNRILLLLILSFSFSTVFSQNQWTWVNGNLSIPQDPVYGIQGVPDAANKPGGRADAATWTDASGNLWMFGGYDFSANGYGFLGDLWKYTVTSRQWTWVQGDTMHNLTGVYGSKGVASAANKPAARANATSWIDPAGNFWLFGGSIYAPGYLSNRMNDLWKYTPSTGQWAWMSGDSIPNQASVYGPQGFSTASNKPGARFASVGWTDIAGNLYLYGGAGFDAASSGSLGDLWKYTPATGQWTWVNGDNIASQGGNYGTKGVASTSNKPGSRYWSTGCTDAAGNFWLMGGIVNGGTMNDLWRFAPSTGLWTWVSGDNVNSLPGVYGTKGIASPANKPGSRYSAKSWGDASGNLWFFGGVGNPGSGMSGLVNDLWKFNTATAQWTWVNGDNVPSQGGIYGTQGIPSASNKPGARSSAIGWADASGNLWLYGGAKDLNVIPVRTNDLWKYSIAGNQWTWMNGGDIFGSLSAYGTAGTPASSNKPGGRQQAVNWKDAAGNLWLFGGNGYAANGYGYLNDLWKYSPVNGQWTWVSGDTLISQPAVYGSKGIAAAANKPGGRAFAVSWTDASGNFWLFGGGGYTASGSGSLNDLWKYTPSTGQWTWISGDSTAYQLGIYGARGVEAAVSKPGARYSAAAWIDASDNLWLWGGGGNAASGTGFLNDLWKFTPSTGRWTWISGDNTINQTGIYGSMGIAASSNKPGARGYGTVTWRDASGSFWLFGGGGYATGSSGNLNDLWKFSPSTGMWTWMSGDNSINQYGLYGTRGIAAATNKPGSRYGSVSWTDAAGSLWLFGGNGYSFTGNNFAGTGNLDDMWKYTPSTGQWTWMNGDNDAERVGVYGVKGVASGNNNPGSRINAVGWNDAAGNLWLFGGNGYTYHSTGYLNDLWKYALPGGAALPVKLSSFTARKQEQTALLQWTTAQEQNSHYFVVERSPDGALYDSIGQVRAMGTSSSATSYSFQDKNTLSGNNFYRIRQMDRDGSFLFSGIVNVLMQEDIAHFAVLQNPVKGILELTVQLPTAQKLTIQIRDMSGHLLLNEIRSGIKGSSVYSLPVAHLAPGTYLIHMQMGNTNSTKTFIRQ